MTLEGRHVLVTGAARGIGAAFVSAALERGAARVFAGVRDLAERVELDGISDRRLEPVRLDVTSSRDITAFAAGCNSLDLLVSNAGQVCKGAVLEQTDDEAWRQVLEVNLFGPVNLVRSLVPALTARRGDIVMVQSVAALALSRSAPLYGASKAAATMVALAMREELRGRGVTLVNVFPGYVGTRLTAGTQLPVASPQQVAERSLDGLSGGELSVFPDRYAELVAELVDAEGHALLDTPRAAMARLAEGFAVDSRAGH